MGLDRRDVERLETALLATPGNVELRLVVAGARLELLDDDARPGDAETALEHARAVLAERPDDREALRIAAHAARALGDHALADRYANLLVALGGSADPIGTDASPPVREPAAPEAAPVVARPDGSHDDIEGESPLWVRIEEGPGENRIIELEVPDVRLDDVGGLEEVKRRLRTSFLAPLENPELREMYRKSLRGGLLLYGPPGCGKTFLARALAGELGANFYAMGLHDVLDMWLGQSERNLHEIFEYARRHTPCVLFLDEVDALGQKRSNLSHSAGRNVVVQLLDELDGVRDENEGLFVLAATNQPWDVDPALRRPGRLDRMLLVLPPDEPARRVIFEYHLRERPRAGDIDVRALAAATEMYSGADIRLVCESAAEAALERSLESGIAQPITGQDLVRARAEVQPSTRAWFDVAKNFAQFSNEGGRYDDLIAYLRKHKLA